MKSPPPRRSLSRHTAAAGAALLVGVLVSFILARLLKRITFGLELGEIADLLSEVEDLAIEQAALQPLATLLATGLATEEVFTAVAEEAGRPVAAGTAQAYRYEPDRSVVRVAAWCPVGGELTAGDQMQTGGRERVRDDGAGGADAAKDSGLNHHIITAIPTRHSVKSSKCTIQPRNRLPRQSCG